MNASSKPVNFPFPIPKWVWIFLLGLFAQPVLASLLRILNEGVQWQTQTWLVVCSVVFAIGAFAGCLIWFIIPGRIKSVLDNFTVRMAGRMTNLEGAIAARMEQFVEELSQLLEDQEKQEGDRAQEILAFTSSIMIDRVITDDGRCQICKQKIKGWEDTPQGDPSHFLQSTHGWLGPGKFCPVPATYRLVHGEKLKDKQKLLAG